jgi:hypothetical protein
MCPGVTCVKILGTLNISGVGVFGHRLCRRAETQLQTLCVVLFPHFSEFCFGNSCGPPPKRGELVLLYTHALVWFGNEMVCETSIVV